MVEQEIFEARLRTALARRVADGPTDFDALEFARSVAAAEPRRHGRPTARTMTLVGFPTGRSPAVRLAWALAAAALLLAASATALFVGGELLRRSNEIAVVPPPALDLTITADSEDLLAVAWSPDGTRIATVGDDGLAKVWDATSGEQLLRIKLGANLGHVAVGYSPDGSRLAAGMGVYDAATGEEVFGVADLFLGYSPDGSRIGAGGAWGWAAVIDAATGDELLQLPLAPSWMWAMAWSPDSTRIATTWGTSVKVWDAATGDEELTIDGLVRMTDVAWSPDGTRIAGGTDLGLAKIWDATTGSDLQILPGQTKVAWSPDGRRFATVSARGTADIWDADSGEELGRFTVPSAVVRDVAWSPDGTRIATASSDGTARIWAATDGVPTPLVPEPSATAAPSSAPTPTPAPIEVGSFRVVASTGYWGDGWRRSPAEVSSLMSAVALRGDYQAPDDPCTGPITPDLPGPEVRVLETLEAATPPERGERSRVRPHGVRVVYRADAAVLRDAFESIVEQIGRCVVELPFREQERDGMIRVQVVPIEAIGDERVAVMVSDVGPDSSGPGWTTAYYWIGFALEGDTLVGVTLEEAWRGDYAVGWTGAYPQPTISDGELGIQLGAAMAPGTIERPGGSGG